MNDSAAEVHEWIVEGRVQGVAFRAAARRQALELGLRGLAENLPDGRVRVLAGGEAAALERFADWLHEGPPAAHVARVTRLEGSGEASENAPPEGFVTR